MTPLHMMILLECNITGSGENMKWDIWVSEAGKKAKNDLNGWGLIDGMRHITDKGSIWLERALDTPMPVQKWVFEGDEE